MGKLYIAYGSNLNLGQMKFRCPDAKVVGASEIKDYELLFRHVATVEPKAGCSVPVLIWDISRRDEAALDCYEGYPTFYRKEMMTVELEGQPTETMVYVMNDGHALSEPSAMYYNIIREGYKTAGFDVKILDVAVENSIERAIAENFNEQDNQEIIGAENQVQDDAQQMKF